MASNIGYERRKAVGNAWKKEKGLVSSGMGTRDWTPKEQKEILSKGKATGYEGHHMKSVDGHNSRAGDVNNIQFLNRKEHLAAHGGNFKNNTNGYYDYKTKETHSFGKYKPAIEARSLSNPLSSRSVNRLNDSQRAKVNATKEKARSMNSRSVNKKVMGHTESKTLKSQRSLKNTASGSARISSKTLSKQRSTPSKSLAVGNKQTKKQRH